MTIEIVMARGWRMWIDGKPTGPFEIGEDDKGGYLLTGLGNLKAIKFDVPEGYWSADNKPTGAVIGQVEDEYPGEIMATMMKVTKLEWGEEDGTPVIVELINGEKIELDEITAYVRLEEWK